MSDKKQMIAVRRTPGPVVHTVGDYEFSAGNGFTAEVDVETAAGLLTERYQRFSLAPGLTAAGRKALAEALGVEARNIVVPEEGAPPPRPEVTVSQIVGGRRGPELAALGITAAGQLAALDDEGIEKLATASGASREEVRGWAKEARAAAAKE